MILSVKTKKSDTFLKIILIILFCVLTAYIYNGYRNFLHKKHNIEKQTNSAHNLEQKNITSNDELENNINKLAQIEILNEVKKTVKLIGQEQIKNVKLVKGKIVFVLEPDTNIDAIIIRYGAMALIKKTFNEIVVVVDLDFLLKNLL